MRKGYSPTPYADEWTILLDIVGGAKWFSPVWLWHQHSEHRLPLVRLALYADFVWLGAHRRLLLALTFTTFVAHWAMWSAFMRAALKLPLAIWLAISGFFGFCIFCPSQTQNLYWGFQWTFVVAFFFASASFLALTWFAENQRLWSAVALSCVAAFLAESSLASGLICWPVLWVSTFALPFRRAHRAVLGGVGLAAIAAYLSHYRGSVYHSNPLETIQQPLDVAAFVLNYYDHCLSYFFAYPALPAIALSLGAWAAIIILFRRSNTHTVALSLAMTVSFVLATAVLTALGRLKFGMEQATASRYQAPVMLYWGCCFVALMLLAWELCSWSHVLALTLTAIALIVLPAENLQPVAQDLYAQAEVFSLAGQSLDYGVIDPEMQGRLVAGYWALFPGTIYMHQRGQAVGPVPPPVSPAIAVNSDTRRFCRGVFDHISPVLKRFYFGPPMVRADGWALDSQTKDPVQATAIVDNNGTLLAAGSLQFGRPDVLTTIHGSTGLVGWSVYVPLHPNSTELRAVAITHGHSCVLRQVLKLNK